MRINSKNMFQEHSELKKRLNAIEKRISLKENKLLQSEKTSINFINFLMIGYQKGFDEGKKTGFMMDKRKDINAGYETGFEDKDYQNQNMKRTIW